MNSVSSAVASKVFRTSLFLPSPSRLAAVKAGAGQFLETPRGFSHGAGVGRIEHVPPVAGVIHHDLRCHRVSAPV